MVSDSKTGEQAGALSVVAKDTVSALLRVVAKDTVSAMVKLSSLASMSSITAWCPTRSRRPASVPGCRHRRGVCVAH